MTVYDRLTDEQRARLDTILRELADLTNERDVFMEDHETIIDVLIDWREDEGLPPYTPEELAALSAECDANADRLNEFDQQIDALNCEYYCLTGQFPFYRSILGRAQFEHPHAIFREDDDVLWEYDNRYKHLKEYAL